jgi:nucleoside-diphosphate-sugar epimerase
MRVFLTGASGYVGSAVLVSLVHAGHHVTGLVRNSEKAERVASLGGTPVIGDLSDSSSYRKAAEGHDGYVIAAFDYARGPQVDRDSIDVILAAARRSSHEARPRFVIYTSGVWVLGNTSQPSAEDAPLDPAPNVLFRPAHERVVLDASADGLRTVVVRPGIVYGGARGIIGDVFRDAMNGLIRVTGAGDNHWPVVYDRDLGDLYVRLANHAGASGLYHANDEGDERVNDIVDAVVRHVPNSPDVRRVPLEEAKAKHGAYAVALALDQIVRSPRARALGWAPSLRSVGGNVARLLEEWRAGEVRKI